MKINHIRYSDSVLEILNTTASRRALYDRRRKEETKQRRKEQSARWSKANPRKAQASTHQNTIMRKYPEAFHSSDIDTKALVLWLEENYGTPCIYCTLSSSHIDHIVPLAKGGAHTWDNIRMICKSCNFAKNDRSEDEFILWAKRIAENTK